MSASVAVVLYGVLGLLIGVVFILFVGASLYLIYKHSQYDHLPGPPRTSFYLGNTEHFRQLMRNGGSFSYTLLEWSQKYGNVFCFWILNRPVVFTSDQELIKTLMVTGNHPKDKVTYEGFGWLYGARLLGRGLVTEYNHEKWTKRRALANPAFNRQFLKTLMQGFNETADDLMDRLAILADGKTNISLHAEIGKATLDVIGKVAFGMDIGCINDQDNPFPAAIFKVLEGFQDSTMDPLATMNPFRRRQYKREVQEAVTLLRQTGRKCLHNRKLAISRGEHVPEDMLTLIINAEKQGANETMDEETTLDDFVTIFIAGQETTANSLGFALIELGRRPDVLRRAREELSDVIGERSFVDYEAVSQMNYLSAVFKEVLRLYPPAPVTFRQPATDVYAQEHCVPAGTTVVMSTFVTSRLPEYVEDALDFDPERFLGDGERRPSPYAYFPFALGPRSCLGQTFAKIEAAVILAKFLQRFEITLDPDQSFDIQETTTMKPKGGTMATLTHRT